MVSVWRALWAWLVGLLARRAELPAMTLRSDAWDLVQDRRYRVRLLVQRPQALMGADGGELAILNAFGDLGFKDARVFTRADALPADWPAGDRGGVSTAFPTWTAWVDASWLNPSISVRPEFSDFVVVSSVEGEIPTATAGSGGAPVPVFPSVALTAYMPWPAYWDILDIADFLGARAEDLALVMWSESGLRSTAHNVNGHASGLNQLMPDTARGLGWRRADPRWILRDQALAEARDAARRGDESARRAAAAHADELAAGLMAEYRAIGPREQLKFVRAYFAPHRGHLPSVGAFYQSNFLPATIALFGTAPETKIAIRGGARYAGEAAAYAANQGFDQAGKGFITVSDLTRFAEASKARAPAEFAEHMVRLAFARKISRPAAGGALGAIGLLAAIGVAGFLAWKYVQ